MCCLILSGLGLGEIKSTDRARLDRAIKTREADVQKAALRFRTAVDDANDKLTALYKPIIAQSEKAGDTDIAGLLRKELADAIATPIDASIETPINTGTSKASPAQTNLNRELIGMLGDQLVFADGSKVNPASLSSVPHVLLYFSASWCGPCKQFTPELVEFFAEHVDSKQVMVILISSDHSPADMMAYMKNDKMPWVAVPFSNIQKTGIKKKYGGKGIPNLVLLNTDGTVKSGSYVDGDYVGPTKVLRDLELILSETATEPAK